MSHLTNKHNRLNFETTHKKQLIHVSNTLNLEDSYQPTTEDETYLLHNIKPQFLHKHQQSKQTQTTTQSHSNKVIFIFILVVILDILYIFNIYLYFIPLIPLGIIAYIIIQSNKPQEVPKANRIKRVFEEPSFSTINTNSFHPELTQSFLEI